MRSTRSSSTTAIASPSNEPGHLTYTKFRTDPYAVGGRYPCWVAVLSDASALALVLVPCSGAVVFGRRASRAGRRHGIIAAVLGAVIAVAWIVLTVASELANPL